MKFFLTAFTLMVSTGAVAASHTTYVTGSGQTSAYCTANDYFCPRNVQQASENNGKDNAAWNCRMDQGMPLSYTATCNTFCSPAYIPPNTPNWVNCRSTCQMQCQIND